MSEGMIVVLVLAVLVIIVLAKTTVVVPQQSAYVVERLGKFSGTLDAGFHILLPSLDVIRYRHPLKEQALDIPEQLCITRDVNQFGNLAKEGNTLVVPATLSDVSAMIAMAMNIIRPGANPESPPAVSQR